MFKKKIGNKLATAIPLKYPIGHFVCYLVGNMRKNGQTDSTKRVFLLIP
jgi:hypothetical protein